MEKKLTGGVSALAHTHTIHKGSAAPLSKTEVSSNPKLPIRNWQWKILQTVFGWLRGVHIILRSVFGQSIVKPVFLQTVFGRFEVLQFQKGGRFESPEVLNFKSFTIAMSPRVPSMAAELPGNSNGLG